jgi:UDP-N-acetylglucosamine 2-epimerase (non-hydrolysing)
MKRLLVVMGTRPNFVKLTRFKEVAARQGIFQVELVHTGQHSAAGMTGVFFEQFALHPDHVLQIPDGSAAARMAHVMLALDPLVDRLVPHAMVVVGDVDSTLAGALVARKRGIPLVHLESGLRSGDMRMPEEVNRILVDRISSLHLVTEESGRWNLRSEGLPADGIHLVGNTMIDTLVKFKDRIDGSTVLGDLELGEGGHVLVTMHRPGTVDHPTELAALVEGLLALTQDSDLVFPVHPRTRQKLMEYNLTEALTTAGVRLVEPLDYFSFQKVLATSCFVVTDSGGVQEETTFRGIPCITLRSSTERPVTLTVGTNRLVPMDPGALRAAADDVRSGRWRTGGIPDLWDGFATERVFAALASLV